MFERFTDRARRTIVFAQDEARNLDHAYIGTEHLLLGLLRESDGIAAQALEANGVTLEKARAAVEEVVPRGKKPVPHGHVPFTPRSKKILELSLREALQLAHDFIGTEHILLALIREGEGVGAQVLPRMGADARSIRQEILQWVITGRLWAPDVHEIQDEIAELRGQTRSALATNDPERAQRLRSEERRLLAERHRRQEAWRTALRDLDMKIEDARLRKDEALDRGDLEEAAVGRAEERRLLAERASLDQAGHPPPPVAD